MKRFLAALLREAANVAQDVVAATVALSGVVLLHHLLTAYGDPMLFDVVPWRYVCDLSDIAIFIALTVSCMRKIVRASKEE